MSGHAAARIEWGDVVIVSGVLMGAATFLFRKSLFGRKGQPLTIAQKAALAEKAERERNGDFGAGGGDYDPARDFVAKMRGADKNVVIFYGSQTGTAEDFAARLAKELQSAAIRPLVLDPELYDWQALAGLGEHELVIWVLATTGEGEPTDNMEAWYDALASDREAPEHSETPAFREPEDKPDFDGEQPLAGVAYAVFGLGNNTYEQFNHHARVVDGRLEALGATRLGSRGEGDDDVDIEEDFAQWKDATVPLVRAFFGAADDEPGAALQFTWTVEERAEGALCSGEFTTDGAAAFDARNPFFAPVTRVVELTPAADRHMVHVEVDLDGSGMRYEAGDHLGVYATNSEDEVDRLLAALGLADKADTAIAVGASDPGAAQQSLFPVPVVTYRAAFSHYLEIAAVVPRAQIERLVLPFAKTQAARSFLEPLATDKQAYAETVAAGCLTVARLIEAVRAAEGDAAGDAFSVPVEAVFELCPRLQPRFYSISSSAKVAPRTPSITAVVLQYDAKGGARRLGVATNYLYALVRRINHGEAQRALAAPRSGVVIGPGAVDAKGHVMPAYNMHALALPVYVRRSAFRLPAAATTPIIMVGPGTGLAPMRGFVQERAREARATGAAQGTALLFFGARTESRDYMYREEIEGAFEELRKVAPASRVITAFSRDQADKVYVQHRLKENARAVYDALLCGQAKLAGPSQAHIYVCGDGKHMAKDVALALCEVIAECEGVSVEVAQGWVADMRRMARYQEDVWG